MLRLRALLLLLPVWLLVAVRAAPAAEQEPVSFRRDVMAVLSRAGCNLGTCHGNKTGKGGFKISLRGDDPHGDYLKLTRELMNRRANPLDPAGSLLLLKPTMVVPHQGGRRFTPDAPEYRLLHDWIAAGMPADPPELPELIALDVTPTERLLVEPDYRFTLRAVARFADGSERDVTGLAVFEPAEPIVEVSAAGEVRRLSFGETTVTVRYLHLKVPVRVTMIPPREDFVWNGPAPANIIDEAVFAKLQQLRVNPSPVCDDVTFLRRVSLDVLGIPPTADEARAFLADSAPDKRARWIDRLLDRPEYADHWALKWSDLLRNEEKTLDAKGVRNFHAWLRAAFAQNRPLDQIVRELVAARGSTYLNPPANYYRAMREPETRAEATAQLFLGIRLQCAKCHNHPFDRWTQDDYYGWSNFFAQIDYKVLENNRRDSNDKHEFDGEQLVVFTGQGSVKHPGTGAAPPLRFLGDAGETPDARRRLDDLADWITSPTNRRFAESQVNRIWFQVMGTGIVDPIDDFRATNPPSHPQLLRDLADEFVRSGYDVRHMLRLILNSHTYQLDSTPAGDNAGETRNFARAAVRRLSAEQLLDTLAVALETPVRFTGYPSGIRAGQLPGVSSLRTRYSKPTLADQFLAVFGKPPRLQTCECERSDETTLKQAFQLVSGPFLQELLTRDENLIARVVQETSDSGAQAEQLSWAILSRPLTAEEHSRIVSFLEGASDHRRALEDVAWAFVTSNEFLLRH